MKPRKRKCRRPGCGAAYRPRSSFQKACSPDCALALVKIQNRKKELLEIQKKKRQQREEDRRTRDRLKTRSKWLQETQVLFNRWIRMTKMGPCITCGVADTPVNPIQAGHFHSVGSRPWLRFEILNVWPQCTRCNMHKSGDTAQFRKILEANLSEKEMEMLDGPGRSDWSIDEIKEIKQDLQAKIKALRARG